MLKEIPRGSTFVIRLVEPLKAGFGKFLSFLLQPLVFSFLLDFFYTAPRSQLTNLREGPAGTAEAPPERLVQSKEGRISSQTKWSKLFASLGSVIRVSEDGILSLKSRLDLRYWFHSLNVGQLGTQCGHRFCLPCLDIITSLIVMTNIKIYSGTTNPQLRQKSDFFLPELPWSAPVVCLPLS